MNINIAFNTIIYIMVFLFPGILFRKGFFSGKFSRHFDYGSAFERIVWAMVFSFICIALFSTLYEYTGSYTKSIIKPLQNIDSTIILQNLKEIYSNKTPSILEDKDHLVGVSTLFTVLYIFSFAFGLLCYWVVTFFEFDRRFSIFKYQNSWNYVLNSSRKSNLGHRFRSIYYTRLDILTKDKELFTGRLLDIVTDKDNKIDAFSIHDSYKFIRLNKSTDQDKIREIESTIESGGDNTTLIKHSETATRCVFRKKNTW
ncbi:MAG: hypothetical protein LRY55_10310 [Leadbetterella sp.]|nr:hypothetical protein [Leadbetterella sp.]